MSELLRRPPRRRAEDHDPLAGLVNLFDLWMVLAVCFLLAALTAADAAAKRSATAAGTAPTEETAKALPKFRASKESLRGQGQRLGVAYRLAGGEVVYVPE